MRVELTSRSATILCQRPEALDQIKYRHDGARSERRTLVPHRLRALMPNDAGSIRVAVEELITAAGYERAALTPTSYYA